MNPITRGATLLLYMLTGIVATAIPERACQSIRIQIMSLDDYPYLFQLIWVHQFNVQCSVSVHEILT